MGVAVRPGVAAFERRNHLVARFLEVLPSMLAGRVIAAAGKPTDQAPTHLHWILALRITRGTARGRRL